MSHTDPGSSVFILNSEFNHCLHHHVHQWDEVSAVILVVLAKQETDSSHLE